jgi:hypothetical protein
MSGSTATRRLPPPDVVAGHPPIGGIDGKDLARGQVFPWPISRNDHRFRRYLADADNTRVRLSREAPTVRQASGNARS